ncbi:MAG: TlpA family protein disulfide reductase [Bacteroidales bacterium]|nr:TlpA family protein disulfide reductase [Bacteroidales bacterium]
MMRIHIGLLILGSILFQFSFSQNVTIKGEAPSYKGETLTFYSHKDYISYVKADIGSCLVDSTGTFNCSFKLNSITETFLDIGKYRGILIVEPGKNYEIELPEKLEKTKADKLNPYFDHTTFYINVTKSEGLLINNIIGQFTDTFNNYYDHNIGYILRMPNYTKLDSDLDSIYFPFRDVKCPYIHTYIYYKFGTLRHMALQFKVNTISETYFLNKKIHYNNPAYMEFFNQVYDRYFIFYGRAEYGKKLYTDIANGDYEGLLNTLGKDQVLANDTLKELVILKNLYDGFYSDAFSHQALLQVLDSLIQKTTIPTHRDIGLNIKEKVTKLLKGYSPPAFRLYNENNELVSIENFKGKYVYLNFCMSSSYACLKEYELLKDLDERLQKYLRIVTIAVDEDFNFSKSVKEKYGYKWTFLHYGNQPEILNDYDIRGFPTYYLISPDGKLIFSPSPSPLENFDYYFYNLLKERGEL